MIAWFAAQVGIVGFLLSLFNVYRAIQAAKEVRALAFAQRKQEALNLIAAGEVSCLTIQGLWRAIYGRAADNSMSDLMATADRFVDQESSYHAQLLKARKGILAKSASGRTHDELVAFIEHTIAELGDLTNASKRQGEAQFVMQESERAIAIFERFTGQVDETLMLISDSLNAYLESQVLLEDIHDAAIDAKTAEVEADVNESIKSVDQWIERLKQARDRVIQAVKNKETADDRLKAAKTLLEVNEIVRPVAGVREIKHAFLQRSRSLRRRLASGLSQ